MPPPDVASVGNVKRIVAASAVLALAGALAPWNGSAGAVGPGAEPMADLMIKVPGGTWVGADSFAPLNQQKVVGKLRKAPGRTVAVVRIVNNGTEPVALDIWASSIRNNFYGGADWPAADSLAPGDSVQFRYVAHRGTAEAGDSTPVDITLRDGDTVLDGVRFLLKAVGKG